jgi:hypothetical protein
VEKANLKDDTLQGFIHITLLKWQNYRHGEQLVACQKQGQKEDSVTIKASRKNFCNNETVCMLAVVVIAQNFIWNKTT